MNVKQLPTLKLVKNLCLFLNLQLRVIFVLVAKMIQKLVPLYHLLIKLNNL